MIRMEQDDGRISLILDRPERKNAFDIPTTLALADALTEVAADRSARVLVIKGCLLYTSDAADDYFWV